MGNGIIKIKDRYMEWSTIVDAPVSPALAIDDFREWYRDKYGRVGLRDFENDLEEIDERGTNYNYTKLETVVELNRAGEKEARITLDEIYERYK